MSIGFVPRVFLLTLVLFVDRRFSEGERSSYHRGRQKRGYSDDLQLDDALADAANHQCF